MSRNKQWWSVVATVVVVALLLSACGGPAPEPQVIERTVEVEVEKIVEVEVERTVVVEPTAEPSGPIELVYWFFGQENQEKDEFDGLTWEQWHQASIDEFEKENPNITVKFQMVGQEYGGTSLYIDAALAAGEPPDILEDWAARVNKYAALGGLEDLSDVIAARGDDYVPGLVDLTTDVDSGLVWGVPVSAAPIHMTVNKSAFEEAGCLDLIPPEDGDRDWTTDEYLAALRCVNDPPNMYGTIIFAKTQSGDYCLQGLLFGFGAKFFDPLGSCAETVINGPEGVAGMEFIKGLVDEGLALPGPAALSDDDLWLYWQQKKLAVSGFYPFSKQLAANAVEEGTADPPYEVYFVNFPHAPDQPPTPITIQSPNALVVFKQKDPERLAAAKTFVIWLMDHEYPLGIATGLNHPLTSLKSNGTPYADDPDIVWILEAIERNGATHPGYNCTKYSETRAVWNQAAQAAWSGDKTVQQALDDYVEEVNALLQAP